MNFITEFEKGQLGENKGLPMGAGLKNLDAAIGGIQKGRIYGIASPAKTGKSTLINYGFLYEPYLYALENNLPVEWIYYSFEIDRISMEFDAATFFLNHDYGIERIQLENQKCRINGNDVDVIPLSPDYLKGMLRDTNGEVIKCKPNIIEALETVYENRIKKIFGEYNEQGELLNKGVVFFRESRDNPTGIYHELIDYAAHRGEIQYKVYGTSKRMVGYNPNDRNLTTIIIMDHIRKLLPERDFSTKQVVDKMMEYFVELRNLFGFTIIPIIHTNRSISDTDTIKFFKDNLYPTSESVKDTGNISEDCNYLITMFNPNDERYNLSSHFGMPLRNADGTKAYPYLRTLHLVESRHCPYPQHFRVNMYGNLKKFEQI